MSEINISSGNIFMVLFFILGIGATIYSLDNFDEKRKKQQIQETYHFVENASYTDSLKILVAKFDTSQHDIIASIQDNFGWLVKENRQIGHGRLFVKQDNTIYRFESYGYNHRHYKNPYQIVSRLAEKDEQLITKIKDHKKDALRILQSVNKDIDHIKTVHFLHEDGENYAIILTAKHRS